MRHARSALLIALLLLVPLAGCGSGSGGPPGATDPAEPAFDPTRFDGTSATIMHPFWPLVAGTTFFYEGETEDATETIEIQVTGQTKVILGITCRVVLDRAYEDGELVEETYDWYAQDTEGHIWYLGEDSTEYDGGVPVSTDGSWEAGVDGAVAGILIKATQVVGDSYQQEYYAGEAEDMAQVHALDVTVQVEDGTIYTGCLQVREWTPLDPGVEEFKFYAPGVGLVRESGIDGSDPIDLVDVTP